MRHLTWHLKTCVVLIETFGIINYYYKYKYMSIDICITLDYQFKTFRVINVTLISSFMVYRILNFKYSLDERNCSCIFISNALDNHHGGNGLITTLLIIPQNHYFVFCAWHPHLIRIPKCPKIVTYLLSYCVLPFVIKYPLFWYSWKNGHNNTQSASFCIIYLLYITI